MFAYMGEGARRTYTPLSLFEHYFLNIEQGRASPNAHSFVREYKLIKNQTDKATREFARSLGDLGEDVDQGNRSGSNYEPSNAGNCVDSGARPRRTRLRRKARHIRMEPVISDHERGPVSLRDQRPLPYIEEPYNGYSNRDPYAHPYPRGYESYHHADYSGGRPARSPSGYFHEHDQTYGRYQDDHLSQPSVEYSEYPEQWHTGYEAPPPHFYNPMPGQYAFEPRHPYRTFSHYEAGLLARYPQPQAKDPFGCHGQDRHAYSQDDYEQRARENIQYADDRQLAQRDYRTHERGYRQPNHFQDHPLRMQITHPYNVDNAHSHHARQTSEPSHALRYSGLEPLDQMEDVKRSVEQIVRTQSNASTILLNQPRQYGDEQHHVHRAAPENTPATVSEKAVISDAALPPNSGNASANATNPGHEHEQCASRKFAPCTPPGQITGHIIENLASRTGYWNSPISAPIHGQEMTIGGRERTANDHINAFNVQNADRDRASSDRMGYEHSKQVDYADAEQSQRSTLDTGAPTFSAHRHLAPSKSDTPAELKSETSPEEAKPRDSLEYLARIALMEDRRLPTNEEHKQCSTHDCDPKMEDECSDDEIRQCVQRHDDAVEAAARARVEKAFRVDAEINASIRRQQLESVARSERQDRRL